MIFSNSSIILPIASSHQSKSFEAYKLTILSLMTRISLRSDNGFMIPFSVYTGTNFALS